MMDKIKDYRIVIVVAIGIIIIAALSYFSFQRYTLMSEYGEDIESKKQEVEEREQELSTYRSFQEDWYQYEEFLQEYEKYIPEDFDIMGFRHFIEETANRYNVEVTAFGIDDTEEYRDYVMQPVNVQLAGNYSQIIQTLSGLYERERIVNLSRIQMERGEKNDTVAAVQIEVFTQEDVDDFVDDDDS